MNLLAKSTVAVVTLSLIAGCGAVGAKERPPLAAGPAAEPHGPAADYPMVLGDPFVIDGVTWRPEDKLNYDNVGFAEIGSDGGPGISVASKTLPLPSYVEVTSLTTGKTILARVERRGPMRNDRLIEFSPGAAAQLGVMAGASEPVRVRRVNPSEPERAALRAGQSAPMRMETPKSLLAVLMRKLQTQEGIKPPVPAAEPSDAPVDSPRPVRKKPVKPKAETARPAPGQTSPAAAQTPPAETARPAPTRGTIMVQAAAFSSRERAEAAASKLGGRVESAGNLFRVRVGPYTTRAEAEAALAKVRRAGYSDARIQRAN